MHIKYCETRDQQGAYELHTSLQILIIVSDFNLYITIDLTKNYKQKYFCFLNFLLCFLIDKILCATYLNINILKDVQSFFKHFSNYFQT